MEGHQSKIGVFALAALVIGCTSPVQNPVAKDAGLINRIYSRHDLRYNAPSCLAALTSDEMAAGSYVQIRTLRGNGYHYFGAIVPPSIPVHIGDEVIFTSDQCKREAIPQVTRVVAHQMT
jgi:hypothetical protein